jgi:hypothetical protein
MKETTTHMHKPLEPCTFSTANVNTTRRLAVTQRGRPYTGVDGASHRTGQRPGETVPPRPFFYAAQSELVSFLRA